jgi:hypothetical protein
LNADIFAEWFQGQGQSVVRTKSSYWVENARHIYQAFPYHWIISPDDDEISDFLVSHSSIGLRYSTPLESQNGLISYHAVLENKQYDEYSVSKWSRKNIRRGLKNCQIRQIPFKLVAEDGWELQKDTLSRQGRKVSLTQDEWRRRWEVASELPGFEAWGAFSSNKLVASVVTFLMDDCCYMLYQQCLGAYLKDHINNALSYFVSYRMIRQPLIKSILYGLHSLDAPPSIDEFKFRMGYYPKIVRQRVVFHPRIRKAFNPLSLKLTQAMLVFFPGVEFLSKAEGMMRFAIEGEKSLEDQTWPEALLSRDGDRIPFHFPSHLLNKIQNQKKGR